jgi:hypothetical protein
VKRIATGLMALSVVFAAPAYANEVMTDRCSGDVSFPPAYDQGPIVPGLMIVTRAGGAGANWSPAIRQQIDGNGHIRWWCHSTTGNWADPGTWTVDDAGATYTCGDNGDCTLSGNASGHPVDVQGWTAERSRCDSHSNTFRARLGSNRLLPIECLENTGQVSRRLIGAPHDISSGGFGNAPPPQRVIRPVQHAPLSAWIGDFVYPRGRHSSDSDFQLTIGRARMTASATMSRLASSAYDVKINEKTRVPFATDQRVRPASIATRGQVPYDKDYVAPRVSVASPGHVSEQMLRVPQALAVHPVVTAGGLGAMLPGQAAARGPGGHAGVNPHFPARQIAAATLGRSLEWADTMTVSPDVSLMLYVAGMKNGPTTGYAIRYIRRSGDRTLCDVMMMPPMEMPH